MLKQGKIGYIKNSILIQVMSIVDAVLFRTELESVGYDTKCLENRSIQ
jgi:hypothetical protein